MSDSKSPQWGWSVYFVQTEATPDKVKIGVTHNLEHRLKSFQTASPYPFVVLHQIMCPVRSHAERLERDLHKRFAPFRFSGEWFDLDPPLSSYLDDAPPYCICRECLGRGDLLKCSDCDGWIAQGAMFIQISDEQHCSPCLAKMAKSSRADVQERAQRLMTSGHWRQIKAA